jgi:hypothetical protein
MSQRFRCIITVRTKSGAMHVSQPSPTMTGDRLRENFAARKDILLITPNGQVRIVGSEVESLTVNVVEA